MPISRKKSGMEAQRVFAKLFSFALVIAIFAQTDVASAARKKEATYAEKVSSYKEGLATMRDRLDYLEDRRQYLKKQLSLIKGFEDANPDDPSIVQYTKECHCGPPNCSVVDDYQANGIEHPEVSQRKVGELRRDQTFVGSVDAGGVNQVNQVRGSGAMRTDLSTTVDRIDEFFNITEAQHEAYCMKLYDTWMTRKKGISPSCKKAMLSCGAVARDRDETLFARELKEIEVEMSKLVTERDEAVENREKLIAECPTCYMQIEQASNRPNGWDFGMAVAPYVRDMVVSGFGYGMYNKYLKTGLSAYNKYLDSYNGYLNNNYQGYQQYIGLCRDMGVPCDQYRGPLPGGFGAGGGGIFGGGMMGNMIGGGMMTGGLYGGGMMGNMVGGGMLMGGLYGGSMYGGSMYGGSMYGTGMYGGGMMGNLIGGGMLMGGLYGGSMYGGSMYGTGMYGGGMMGNLIGGGMMMGGLYGGSMYGGGMMGNLIGGGMMMGGLNGGSMYGTGMYGGNMMGMMMGGGYDAAYLLQQQRMAMGQQNIMLAQQQMMETQMRYQNIMSGMSYGGMYGNSMYGGSFVGGGGLGYLNFGMGTNPYMYPGMSNGTVPPLATPPYY